MKTSREIALERRKAMSDSGKKAVANSSTTKDRVRTSDDMQISGIKSSIDTNTAKKHIPTTKMNKKSFSKNLSSKELVIERRKAMSTHGKSAISSSDRTRTEANKKIQVNEIKITSDKKPLAITFDGHETIPLQRNDQVIIKKSKHTLNLIHPNSYDYYNVLRNKLGWSNKFF